MKKRSIYDRIFLLVAFKTVLRTYLFKGQFLYFLFWISNVDNLTNLINCRLINVPLYIIVYIPFIEKPLHYDEGLKSSVLMSLDGEGSLSCQTCWYLECCGHLRKQLDPFSRLVWQAKIVDDLIIIYQFSGLVNLTITKINSIGNSS